jgi:hypothetical protein
MLMIHIMQHYWMEHFLHTLYKKTVLMPYAYNVHNLPCWETGYLQTTNTCVCSGTGVLRYQYKVIGFQRYWIWLTGKITLSIMNGYMRFQSLQTYETFLTNITNKSSLYTVSVYMQMQMQWPLPLQGFHTNFTSKWMFTAMNMQVAPEDIALGERFFYTHHMKKVCHTYVCRNAVWSPSGICNTSYTCYKKNANLH